MIPTNPKNVPTHQDEDRWEQKMLGLKSNVFLGLTVAAAENRDPRLQQPQSLRCV
jgi:hypothetical protein